ncbi:ring domain at very C-terminus of large protein [Cryptosporidium ryanae]|uniref:ring domain at very C-terminus of large protein n=1 Tax=Cryptosporidium ryanae TaxID=515981 RepID=UPI00351A385A|nr:ring domain at very C-terminus of large protein [Cryptosporidium ryanae]
MSKGKGKSSINSSKAKALLGENNKAGVATSLWGIFTEFNEFGNKNNTHDDDDDQLNTSLLHPLFVPIFANISKKDCSTRLKGLITFKEKLRNIISSINDTKIKSDLDENIVFDWDPVLSNFTYIYIRLGVYDSDVNVRKLSNECLLLLHIIVGGKKFEKYCKLFFPALWLSCNDPKPDVLKSANDCLNKFIKKESSNDVNLNNYKDKIIRLINHCDSSMFDLYGRILGCNINNIKSELNANVSSQSEEEELFDRLISTSLASLRKVLEVYEMNNEDSRPNEFSLLLSSYLIFNSKPDYIDYYVDNKIKLTWNTLQPGLIWKFISSSFSSVVRVDAIKLITYSLSIIYNSMKFVEFKNLHINNSIFFNISTITDIFISVINCFGNSSNPNVQSVSPKLLLMLSRLFPEIWKIEQNKKFKSPIKHFSKILYSCLCKPNQLSSVFIYSELPQIIASIPVDILIGEFKAYENNYFSNDGHLCEIMKLLNKKDFYFESITDFVYFINEHLNNNSLPLICLLPFIIIFPMIRLNTNNDLNQDRNINNDNIYNNTDHIKNKDQIIQAKNIFLGTSNFSILNKSIETYYTMILFVLCNRISNISIEETEIKDFLFDYYSKLIWIPLVFSLILKKSESIHNSSSNFHKAQTKLNEQFSNMMLDSIQYHNWTIEECKTRKLDTCIKNLIDFCSEYWNKYYFVYLPNLKNNNINQITFNREIYLSGCLTLVKAENLFFDSVLCILEKSIIQLFSKIETIFSSCNSGPSDYIDILDFNWIVYNSFLVSKFINSVLINGVEYVTKKHIYLLNNVLIENYKRFISIIGDYFYDILDKKIDNLYMILFITDSIFVSLIAVSSKYESREKSILVEILNADLYKNKKDSQVNITNFIIILSFIHEKLIKYNSINCITHEHNIKINSFCELLINKICFVLKNHKGSSSYSVTLLSNILNKENEMFIGNSFNLTKKGKLDIERLDINSKTKIEDNLYNLFIEILKNQFDTSFQNFNYNYLANFIENYISIRFKYLNEGKGSYEKLNLNEIVKLKDITFEYLKRNDNISYEFLNNLITTLVYSNNENMFDIKSNSNSQLKNFIKIIDSVFLYSYIHINDFYECIINRLEIMLLDTVFGLSLDSEIKSEKEINFSTTKIVILIERNANIYLMDHNDNEEHSVDSEKSSLIERTTLEIIINRLSDILSNYDHFKLFKIRNNFSVRTGFKISNFLRTYKSFRSLMVEYDYCSIVYPIKNTFRLKYDNKLSVNEAFILSNLRDIFISKLVSEFMIDSNTVKFIDFKLAYNEEYFQVSNIVKTSESDQDEIEYCEYLINKGITKNCFKFKNIIKNANTFLDLNMDTVLYKYTKFLLLLYYKYIYKLFENNIEYKYLYIKESFLYLIENINIENNSQLFEFIMDHCDILFDKNINEHNELIGLATNVLDKYQSCLFSYSFSNNLNELSIMEMFAEYILIILNKFEDKKFMNLIYDKIHVVTSIIEKLIKELEVVTFSDEKGEHFENLVCIKLNISSNLIKIISKFIEDTNLKNGIVFDTIGFEYEYNNQNGDIISFDISKLLIGVSSTVHYLVGCAFGISTKYFADFKNSENITVENTDLTLVLKSLSKHASLIENIVLDSLHLSSVIYSGLNKECENLQDELRFSSITIPIEANTIEIYDKVLGLISTMYNMILSANNTYFDNLMLFILDHSSRIKNTEISGKKWIVSISDSNLGSIKGNAMEISRLLTTYSIELHSFVLIILKEHNWHNVQYEYYDLETAILSIEKLQNTIKDYLILKNREIDDLDNEINEDYDGYIDKYTNNNIDDESFKNLNNSKNKNNGMNLMVEDCKLDFNSNFESGIYVIASHWRRLIGPSLSRQLIETYLSALNVVSIEIGDYDEEENYTSKNNFVYMDLSQRLGCWCFMLPKLISNDFVICVDSENSNIKTIKQTLTPCVEFLLELKPLLVGEAVNDYKVDLFSKQKNEFLPSCVEDDDISICKSLLTMINNKKCQDCSFEPLDDITLKNTTFNSLRDLIKRDNIQEHVNKTFELPLIHVLVELSFQTLVILDDYFYENEGINSYAYDSTSQINWIELFKHASNIERRNLLICNLEDILVPDLNYSSKQCKSNIENKGIWSSNNLTLTWLLTTRIILSLTRYFPRILREIWLCNKNKRIQKTLQKLVLNYFSPIIVQIEVNYIPIIIEELSNLDKKITYNHNYLSRTVKVDYSERGFSATLTFTFSECHPLVIPKISVPNASGISKKQISNWLIPVIKATRYKNVTHAILTWINNISLFLEGIEDCLICYSIVHHQYRSLPKKRCSTCKNIFHSECIYKWFRSSNKTTCPFCISIMN